MELNVGFDALHTMSLLYKNIFKCLGQADVADYSPTMLGGQVQFLRSMFLYGKCGHQPTMLNVRRERCFWYGRP